VVVIALTNGDGRGEVATEGGMVRRVDAGPDRAEDGAVGKVVEITTFPADLFPAFGLLQTL